MHSVCGITPGVLATIAASWSEAELHAAAVVLADLLRDRCGAASVPLLEPEVAIALDGSSVGLITPST